MSFWSYPKTCIIVEIISALTSKQYKLTEKPVIIVVEGINTKFLSPILLLFQLYTDPAACRRLPLVRSLSIDSIYAALGSPTLCTAG